MFKYLNILHIISNRLRNTDIREMTSNKILHTEISVHNKIKSKKKNKEDINKLIWLLILLLFIIVFHNLFFIYLFHLLLYLGIR